MLTNSSWTNARQKFREWRRSRPFWGGLLLLLSGIELFASANLDLTAIQFHIGPEGFLSYLLPVLLLVCGLLVWLTPNQRIFYAIIGSLTAVYALIGLNLGGFLLGTLIGMVGGGMAFAWTPDGEEPGPVLPAAIPAWARRRPPRRTDSTVDESDSGEDEYGESGAVTGRHLDESAGGARHRSPLAVTIGVPLLITATLAGTLSASPSRAVAAPTTCPTNPAQLAGGPPQAAVPPAVAGQPAAAPPAAAPPAAPPAAAPPAVTTTSAAPPAVVHTTTAATPTAAPTSSGPVMSRTPTQLEILLAIQHNVINAWVEFWAKVFGIPLPPKPTPTPTATPKPTTPPPPPPPTTTTTQPAPTTAPATTSPAGGSGGGGGGGQGPPTTTKGGAPATGTCAPTSGAAAAPQAAAPAGQPNVSDSPATLTAATQILNGFSFVGVTSLPTADGGSIKVLQFQASRATSVDFTLSSDAGGRHSLSINSNPLVVSGTVNLFASVFEGKLLGIPLKFTADPEVVPPLTLPDMTFTDVTIQLVFLDTTTLQAPTLAQTSN